MTDFNPDTPADDTADSFTEPDESPTPAVADELDDKPDKTKAKPRRKTAKRTRAKTPAAAKTDVAACDRMIEVLELDDDTRRLLCQLVDPSLIDDFDDGNLAALQAARDLSVTIKYDSSNTRGESLAQLVRLPSDMPEMKLGMILYSGFMDDTKPYEVWWDMLAALDLLSGDLPDDSMTAATAMAEAVQNMQPHHRNRLVSILGIAGVKV